MGLEKPRPAPLAPADLPTLPTSAYDRDAASQLFVREDSTTGLSTALDQAMDRLEAELGGRTVLQDTALLAAIAPSLLPQDSILRAEKADQLARLLADPAHAGQSLGTLARHCGLALKDLYTIYRDARTARAHLQAINTIAEHLPATVQDVMAKSAPYEGTCSRCLGAGSITALPTPDAPNPSPSPCTACGGDGTVTYQPDHDVQKTALTLGGLLKSGAGIAPSFSLVNTRTTVHMGAGADAIIPIDQHTSAFLRMQQAADAILYGSAGSPTPKPVGRGSTVPETADIDPPDEDTPPDAPAP